MYRTTRLLLAALFVLLAAPAHAAFQQGVGICETSTTTGTGTLNLAGAYTTSTDYLSFASQITSTNTVPYTIESSDGKFEHGLGVFTDAAPDTLTRASEIVSSDGVGTKLTLPAGTHIVCLQSGIDVAFTNPILGANLNLDTFSLVYGATTILSDSGGTTTLSNIDALEATTESTIEAAIDTLANLTNVQGRTVTLADAGANSFFGWDDTAGAYENLTAAEAEAIMEPLIDTLANLTNVQGLTITLTDAGADAVWGWDDSASAYENLTGAEVAAAIGDNIALTTNTTGNYVASVADGTGVDGTASGEGATYTPSLDLTEISSGTWGAGSFTTFTFDAGATDPTLTFGSGTLLIEAVTSLRQADAANAGGQLKWLEDPGTGSNFISILAPASIASDVTCTLENDSNPIPDSCVGDGTDNTGAGIAGSTGATDNSILRADGTGGATLQNSVLIIADTSGAISGAASGFSIEFFGATGTDTTLSSPGAGRLQIEGVEIFTVAGNGLTNSTQTLAVGAGTCITSNANDVAVTADCIGPTQIDETASYAWSNAASTVTGAILFDGDALQIDDTGGDHQLIITPGTNLTADRVLTLTTGDAARTITLNGNPTLNDWFDQSVKTTATPTFSDVTTTDDVIVGNAITLAVDGGGQITTSAGTLIYQTAQSITNPAILRLHETTSSGTNFKGFAAAATITSDNTCVFENDSHFIPDSCVGDGADASDGRLKTDLRPLNNPGALLDQIKIYDYEWAANSDKSEQVIKGKRGVGPVAQELFNVNADWVEVGGEDPVNDPWEWKPERLVPYLIAETQSLRRRVKELEGSFVSGIKPVPYTEANALQVAEPKCYGLRLGHACIGVSM